jgi:hypothetical protein
MLGYMDDDAAHEASAQWGLGRSFKRAFYSGENGVNLL